MERIDKIYSLSNYYRYLIDYSNLITGIIANQQKFADSTTLNKFYNKLELGYPLILPSSIKYFKHSKNFYLINKNFFLKRIYKINNKFYNPFTNNFLYGNKISYEYNLKKKYFKIVEYISNINLDLKKFIKFLKKKRKTVGAFQTRNIPHLGHELIIRELLKRCDYVIINPVVGPKKKGDIRPEVLEKVYKFYINKFFKNKNVFFKPIIANMFYSGPREAIHHALIREKLGFDYFIVGRDHAGAESAYSPSMAIDAIKKHKKKLKIKIITHQGSYYCTKCKRIVLKENCKKDCSFLDISGSEFRNNIILKKNFKYARPELNKFLKKFKKIFYND